ncbi:PSD1 and planctomycete cytochrome C domain-containing protein [Candidatus Laterigemmans baculatus]|uniref:PSD1 and planctomycete cytochrome C domain-containing protein n=1 Tax=Candidatus Laterigemmans baculatus TaxID=2770505 RepID=UPI001F420EA1|nr:PSD1 and planctomycete cytochrome C domain-containing protein [Candidatus Laterigemmans baculatus]
MNHSAYAVACTLVLLIPGAPPAVQAKPVSPEDRTFFETRIRPVLVEHCYECHAADSADLGGGLRLDSHDAIRRGGQTGSVLVAGEPADSLLIQALRYEGPEMPPEQPLPESVIRDFEVWVERGAPDPRTEEPPPKTAEPQEEVLWSLEPLEEPPLPKVARTNWPRDRIDHFVLARIEAAGLSPTRDADPRTLARRLHYDLIGLPPSLEAIETFVAASERDGAAAVERLVDRLLASPQFGVRWGRHWLDVARYGESNGNDGLGRNPTFPHAWRYRDYVIDAFNRDTPYDQFLTEQIAGDLLAADSPEQRDRQLVATGFLALTAKPAKAMNENFAMDVVADQIDVIGRGVMGISVACARCHDHKFDPIPMRDYYALAGLFTSTDTLWGVAAHEGLTAPPTDVHVLQAAPTVLPPPDFVETVLVLDSNTGEPRPIPKSKWAPGTPLAMGVRDRKEVADCKININGESKKLGDAIPRGFLSAVSLEQTSPITVDPQQSGRLQLAQWLTHPTHPLTSRVMVNRVWMHLFGEGLVRTPDDFGKYGEAPTHPELLDHLALRFVDSGWSIKRLIRTIVLSRTYQLSSSTSDELVRTDGANRLLARHNYRRLDAEALRDSMLQVSDQLDLRPADGSIIRHRDILVNLAGNLHQPSNLRSVYLCYLRSSPPPELAAFDLPEFTSVTGRRDTSTVPGQALHLYNSSFVIAQANSLARCVLREAEGEEPRVRAAFRRALGREPAETERTAAKRLLHSMTGPPAAAHTDAVQAGAQADSQDKVRPWASLCQALLITNEFRYVD